MTCKVLTSIDEAFSLCVHVCMCNICTWVCVEARRCYWISSSVALYFLRQCLPVGLEFSSFARLDGQQDSETFLSLPLHHWVFMWVLGIWIQFLLLSWQSLYWVGYLITSLMSFSEWDDLPEVHRESLSQNNSSSSSNNNNNHHQNPNVIHLSYSVPWLSNLRGYIGSLLLFRASLWRFVTIFSIFFFCGLRCGPNQEAENRWPILNKSLLYHQET